MLSQRVETPIIRLHNFLGWEFLFYVSEEPDYNLVPLTLYDLLRGLLRWECGSLSLDQDLFTLQTPDQTSPDL